MPPRTTPGQQPTAGPAAAGPRTPAVAIDVTPLLGARSGIGVATSEILDALRALDEGPALIPYTLSVRARLHRADAPKETRFVPLPARLLLKAWARTNGPRIDRWLRPANVVHATNYLTPPSRLPTLITVYDCSFVRYPELCTPEVKAFEPIVRRAIERGATVHTGSSFVADEIEEIFGHSLRASGRLVVIPLGVPALGERSEMPPVVERAVGNAPFVLAIGTLEPRKNIPHLVAAFGLVARDDADLRLVVAGHDGPARPAVDRAIDRLPPDAARRVVLAGGVTDAGRRALLEHATVLAYPSIYEGFGFPLLEAMSAGVPVVTARAGSIPEVAGDAAAIVDATDEAALAREIANLVNNDDLRREMADRGHARVATFSWQSTARQLNDCYRMLAKERT